MSRKQFNSALRRNGFRQTPLGLWFVDTTGVCPATHFGALLHPKTFKMLRRATLAKLIKDRRRMQARQQKEANT